MGGQPSLFFCPPRPSDERVLYKYYWIRHSPRMLDRSSRHWEAWKWKFWVVKVHPKSCIMPYFINMLTSFLLMISWSNLTSPKEFDCYLSAISTDPSTKLAEDCLWVYLTPRIPNSSPLRPSQKPSPGDISGTKSGRIYPLVSKRPEKSETNSEKKISLKKKKIKSHWQIKKTF